VDNEESLKSPTWGQQAVPLHLPQGSLCDNRRLATEVGCRLTGSADVPSCGMSALSAGGAKRVAHTSRQKASGRMCHPRTLRVLDMLRIPEGDSYSSRGQRPRKLPFPRPRP